MSLIIRRARPEDRQKIFNLEEKATPGLIYLPFVFDHFIRDEEGDFLVAEIDSQLVGCGKFTLLPDGSAWLETLRVLPERQGQGIGKQFYERFLEIAHSRKVVSMRMYTGVRNKVSKGLAERFGFKIAGTYRGQKLSCLPAPTNPSLAAFQPVKDPKLASDLLLSQRAKWADFMVMNRTFYNINSATASYLVEQGMFYYDPAAQNIITLGARFMPGQALHIGVFCGDATACLSFALYKAAEVGAGSINCLSPAVDDSEIQAELTRHNYQFESSEFIVMEANLA